MDKPEACPRCGFGKDTDGDGDCPICAHWDAGHNIIPAIIRMLRRVKEPDKDAMRKQA